MSFRQPNEDLFETSRMTFGEHLEELRGVLIKALVAIAIGCGIGFFFAENVVKILVEPLASAMEDYDRETARRSIIERDGDIPPEYQQRIDESNMAPRRVMIDPAQLFPEKFPAGESELVEVDIWEPVDFKPQSLAATDGFMIWVKAAVVTGLTLALPFVMYFLWSFVAAGLYPHEQKYVHLFLPISIGLFVAGVCLAFFFVFQPVLGFLFSFNRSMNIAPEMRINDWLSFVLFLPLGFGVAFQLPLVMLFMNRIGLFTIEAYLGKWRIAVMCIFLLSMVLTPADPISMLLMAVPLTLLYFVGIAMCRWLPANENPFGDVEPER